MTTTTNACPNCNGTGSQLERAGDYASKDLPEYAPCTLCHGGELSGAEVNARIDDAMIDGNPTGVPIARLLEWAQRKVDHEMTTLAELQRTQPGAFCSPEQYAARTHECRQCLGAGAYQAWKGTEILNCPRCEGSGRVDAVRAFLPLVADQRPWVGVTHHARGPVYVPTPERCTDDHLCRCPNCYPDAADVAEAIAQGLMREPMPSPEQLARLNGLYDELIAKGVVTEDERRAELRPDLSRSEAYPIFRSLTARVHTAAGYYRKPSRRRRSAVSW